MCGSCLAPDSNKPSVIKNRFMGFDVCHIASNSPGRGGWGEIKQSWS